MAPYINNRIGMASEDFGGYDESKISPNYVATLFREYDALVEDIEKVNGLGDGKDIYKSSKSEELLPKSWDSSNFCSTKSLISFLVDGGKSSCLWNRNKDEKLFGTDYFVFYNFVEVGGGPLSYYPGSVAVQPQYQQQSLYPGQRTKSVMVPTLTQCPTCHRNTLMTQQVIEVPDPDAAVGGGMTRCPTCQAALQMPPAVPGPGAQYGVGGPGSMMVPKLRQCPSCGRNTLWTQEAVNASPAVQYQESLCTTCRTPIISAQPVQSTQPSYPTLDPYASYNAPIAQQMPFSYAQAAPQQPASVTVPKITNCGTCGQTMVSYESIAINQQQLAPAMQKQSYMVQKTAMCPECHRNTLMTNEMVTKDFPSQMGAYQSSPAMYAQAVPIQMAAQPAQSMVKIPTTTQCPECHRNTLVTYQNVPAYGGDQGAQNYGIQSYGMMGQQFSQQQQQQLPQQQQLMSGGGTDVRQCPTCRRMTLLVQKPLEYQKVFCETCMQPIDYSGTAGQISNAFYAGGASMPQVLSQPQTAYNAAFSSPSYTMVNNSGPTVKQSVVPTLTQCPECRRNTLWANQTVSYVDNSVPQYMTAAPQQQQPPMVNPATAYAQNIYTVPQQAISACPVCMRPMDSNPSAAVCPLCKRPTIY